MQFYVLNDFHVAAETIASLVSNFNVGPADVCLKCGEDISLLRWAPPFRVNLKLRGTAFGDLVCGLSGNELLVSELFADVWRHLGFQGLSGFNPVEVIKVTSRRKKRPEPPRYLRADVRWGAPAIDQQASGIEWLQPPRCDECLSAGMMRWQRVVIKQGTWNGEDIFIARGFPASFIVTERFKSMCADYQIKHAPLTPAEDFSHDFYPGVTDPASLEG